MADASRGASGNEGGGFAVPTASDVGLQGCFDAGGGKAAFGLSSRVAPPVKPTRASLAVFAGPDQVHEMCDLCGPERHDTPDRGGRSDKGFLTREAQREAGE